jgi:TM2 domain/zinc-ribbon domain
LQQNYFMYCNNCGAQIDDKAAICIKCGVATNTASINSTSVPPGQFEWLTVLLLCIFLGGLGVHSFYTKKTGIGVVQLLTLGGCGIWVLVDFIMILTGSFKDGNGKTLYRK